MAGFLWAETQQPSHYSSLTSSTTRPSSGSPEMPPEGRATVFYPPPLSPQFCFSASTFKRKVLFPRLRMKGSHELRSQNSFDSHAALLTIQSHRTSMSFTLLPKLDFPHRQPPSGMFTPHVTSCPSTLVETLPPMFFSHPGKTGLMFSITVHR